MRCGYRKLYMESLEIRWVLSFLFGHTDVAIEASDSVTPGQNGPREDFADAKPFKLAALDARSGNGGGGGKGGGGKPASPVIRFDVVALHEFGHSLGLGHRDGVPSIMNSYYNPSYDMSFFNAGQDPATDALKDYYANPGANAWTDVSQDGGTTDLTCSFVPNKTLVDQGRSTKVPSEANPFVLNELQRWATTTGFFTFTEVTDAGGQFNDVGAPQADPDAGDIRATL